MRHSVKPIVLGLTMEHPNFLKTENYTTAKGLRTKMRVMRDAERHIGACITTTARLNRDL